LNISDSLFIDGKGISISNRKKYKEGVFVGKIGFSEIKELEISEAYIPAIILYPAVFVLSVSIIGGIYLAIVLDGRSFGG
jgi:hypothetical protein